MQPALPGTLLGAKTALAMAEATDVGKDLGSPLTARRLTQEGDGASKLRPQRVERWAEREVRCAQP